MSVYVNAERLIVERNLRHLIGLAKQEVRPTCHLDAFSLGSCALIYRSFLLRWLALCVELSIVIQLHVLRSAQNEFS